MYHSHNTSQLPKIAKQCVRVLASCGCVMVTTKRVFAIVTAMRLISPHSWCGCQNVWIKQFMSRCVQPEPCGEPNIFVLAWSGRLSNNLQSIWERDLKPHGFASDVVVAWHLWYVWMGIRSSCISANARSRIVYSLNCSHCQVLTCLVHPFVWMLSPFKFGSCDNREHPIYY